MCSSDLDMPPMPTPTPTPSQEVFMPKKFKVTVAGKPYDVMVEELKEGVQPKITVIEPKKEALKEKPVLKPVSHKERVINSLFQGSILKISVKVGDWVKEGDTMILMEAMKMEIQIKAPVQGEVLEINVDVGNKVSQGDRLMSLLQ